MGMRFRPAATALMLAHQVNPICAGRGRAQCGGDGDVGVIESGDFTFSQSGEGQCYQGVVAYAAALSGTQQTLLLVLGKRASLGSEVASQEACLLSAFHCQQFQVPGNVISRDKP